MAIDVSITTYRVDEGYLSTLSSGEIRTVGGTAYSNSTVTGGGTTSGAVYLTGTQIITGYKIFDGSIRLNNVISDVSTNKILYYDTSTGDISYADASWGGGGTTINTLGDVGDVSIVSVDASDGLLYDGVNWVNVNTIDFGTVLTILTGGDY